MAEMRMKKNDEDGPYLSSPTGTESTAECTTTSASSSSLHDAPDEHGHRCGPRSFLDDELSNGDDDVDVDENENDEDGLAKKNDDLRVLVCTANFGRAPPTFSSVAAMVPEAGRCDCDASSSVGSARVPFLRYDVVALGLQEVPTSSWWPTSAPSDRESKNLEELYQNRLGPEYMCALHHRRGEMRLLIFVVREAGAGGRRFPPRQTPQSVNDEGERSHGKLLEPEDNENVDNDYNDNNDDDAIHDMDVRVGGEFAHHHLGGPIPNPTKGGIFASLTVRGGRRLSFVTVHLPAYEGHRHYRNRCRVMARVIAGSDSVTNGSHWGFVFGDLNFRLSYDDAKGEKGASQGPVDRAEVMRMVRAEEWHRLHALDELRRAMTRRDVPLHGFETCMCCFPPTYKVRPGNHHHQLNLGSDKADSFSSSFDAYSPHRRPGYTDRILWRCADPGYANGATLLRPLCYEPCPAVHSASDHVPLRAGFAVPAHPLVRIPRSLVSPAVPTVRMRWTLRVSVRGLKCRGPGVKDAESRVTAALVGRRRRRSHRRRPSTDPTSSTLDRTSAAVVAAVAAVPDRLLGGADERLDDHAGGGSQHILPLASALSKRRSERTNSFQKEEDGAVALKVEAVPQEEVTVTEDNEDALPTTSSLSEEIVEPEEEVFRDIEIVIYKERVRAPHLTPSPSTHPTTSFVRHNHDLAVSFLSLTVLPLRGTMSLRLGRISNLENRVLDANDGGNTITLPTVSIIARPLLKHGSEVGTLDCTLHPRWCLEESDPSSKAYTYTYTADATGWAAVTPAVLRGCGCFAHT